MKNILIVDNYDSFTYNLYHLIKKSGNYKVEVQRNDLIEPDSVKHFDKIVLSPGPGIPDEAGLLKTLIHQYATSKSILGVCLGHQAIGEVFGAELKNLKQVYHGIQTPINLISCDYIFDQIETPFLAGRYHSWIISHSKFPETLEITAESDEKLIMAIKHKELDIHGIQFHPESILTPQGEKIIENFLKA